MPRAIWKGTLRLPAGTQKSFDVPLKLFSAASDKRVHFRLLHALDQEPVEQRWVDPETEETVERAATQLGYPVAPGTFVVLSARELEELEPRESRNIELLRFVGPGALGPEWDVRPYYLGPDGDSTNYSALAQALAAEGQVGIVRWVMRKHAYVGALRSSGDRLNLSTLHHSDEIIPAQEIAPEHARAPDAKERAMAEQLVGLFAGEFDPSAYHDDYRERVRALAEAKARGKRPKLHPRKPPRPTEGDLAAVLAASLKRAQGRRVA